MQGPAKVYKDAHITHIAHCTHFHAYINSDKNNVPLINIIELLKLS